MGFKTGQPRPPNAGRKKGTPNKKSGDYKALLEQSLGKTIPERMIEILTSNNHKVDAIVQLEYLMRMTEFCYPKLKALEVNADVEVNSTEIEVDQLATELVRQIKES